MGDSPRKPRLHVRREYAAEVRWTFVHRRSWLIGFTVNLVLAAAFIGISRYSPRTGGLRLAGLAAASARCCLMCCSSA